MELNSVEHAKHARTVHFGLLVLCATLIVISQREVSSPFVRARKDFLALTTSLEQSLHYSKLHAYLKGLYAEHGSPKGIPAQDFTVAVLGTQDQRRQVTCYRFVGIKSRENREFSIYRTNRGALDGQAYLLQLLRRTGFAKPSDSSIVINPFQPGRFQDVYRPLYVAQPLDRSPRNLEELKEVWGRLDGTFTSLVHLIGTFRSSLNNPTERCCSLKQSAPKVSRKRCFDLTMANTNADRTSL